MDGLIFILFILYIITRAYDKANTKKKDHERRKGGEPSTVHSKTTTSHLPEKEVTAKIETSIAPGAVSVDRALGKTKVTSEMHIADREISSKKRVGTAGKGEQTIQTIPASKNDLIMGVVYSEILGRPRSLNQWKPQNHG
ncbi:MAG: hypothetical protein GX318_00625 [Clostridia bacterium]|nr:hypothetical protein [Clostridia bacterium]